MWSFSEKTLGLAEVVETAGLVLLDGHKSYPLTPENLSY